MYFFLKQLYTLLLKEHHCFSWFLKTRTKVMVFFRLYLIGKYMLKRSQLGAFCP